jgi:hypothetical protein
VEFEQAIEELKKAVPFKETTVAGDIVLVVTEDPQAVMYGVVAGITRDTTKRDEWWHVSLHLLALPPQHIVWTLRTPQFTGQEIFEMGGKKRFFKAVAIKMDSAAPSPAGPKECVVKKGALRVVK